MTPKRLTGITAAAAIAAGVLGAGLALTLCRGLSASPRALATPSAKTSFAYYETVARRFAGGQPQGYGSMMRTGGYGSMMGGAGYSWTMSQSGYTRMMGGANAPGWMTGGSLPASMMEGRHDPSKVMGKLFANAPGARVSKAQAARLGNGVPSGATVDHRSNTILFSSQSVDLAVVASPSMPSENFRAAGLSNPNIVVPQGARVRVEFVNADPDMAHGFVVATQAAGNAAMPMMTAKRAFSGSALWFLGDPTSAGLHAATLSFTVSSPGTYSYFCPLPGHAQEGMVGSFVVERARAS